MKILKTYLELCKIPISFFAACSAATGFMIGPRHPAAYVVLPILAVFVLACGSSALNQYEERDIDARMERTKGRPLPSGAVTPRRALAVSLVLLCVGLILLARASGVIGVGLGLLADFWYTVIYTFLKRKTAFASVPGALVGVIPPTIGWVSGGGGPADTRIFVLCLLFFLWQIPHFWLLILGCGEEYEKAGLPSLTQVLRRTQIARISFVWIFATATASLSLPLYGMGKSPVVYFTLIPAAVWIVWHGTKLLHKTAAFTISPSAFRGMNWYIFMVMALLSLDRIIYRLS